MGGLHCQPMDRDAGFMGGSIAGPWIGMQVSWGAPLPAHGSGCKCVSVGRN